MHQLRLDIHGALQWISDFYDDLVAKFLRAWNNIPVYGGPMDFEVRTYTEGVANWVRGHDQWSFEVQSLPYCHFDRTNNCLSASVTLVKRVGLFRRLVRSFFSQSDRMSGFEWCVPY